MARTNEATGVPTSAVRRARARRALPRRGLSAARAGRGAQGGAVRPPPWEKVGAGAGLVALTAMAVQFVTSGRFEKASGRLGIDRIMSFHKIAAGGFWVRWSFTRFSMSSRPGSRTPDLGVQLLVAYHVLPH